MAISKDFMAEIYIDRIINFSDIEINALFDTVYTGKHSLTPVPHSHFNYEVQACLEGEYTIESDNRKCIAMKPDELCVIPAGYLHSSKLVTKDPERLAFRFHLKQSTLKNDGEGCYNTINSILTRNKNPICFHSHDLTELIKKIHTELYLVGNNQGAVSEILLIQFFSSLFAAIMTEAQKNLYEQGKDDDRNSRAFKIENFFDNNYFRVIFEQNLADYLNLSVRQTSRELKKLYGMSFREKLISIRMTNAAKLLLRTNFSVSMVAAKVGYGSNPGFCTSFKKFYDISPKEYKIKYKEKA